MRFDVRICVYKIKKIIGFKTTLLSVTTLPLLPSRPPPSPLPLPGLPPNPPPSCAPQHSQHVTTFFKHFCIASVKLLAIKTEMRHFT